jgi:RND family efflux transporter MFP subunit
MRKAVVIAVVAILGLAGFLVYGRGDKNDGADSAATSGTPGGGRAGGRGGRPPMPVEFATAKRAQLSERVLVVGNLIGAATVQAVPKINGRLATVNVQLGDPVRKGQTIAKVEDREIQEQVRQAEAAYKVGEATIRQREADLRLAQTNLERNRSLLDRQLLPKQTFDDTDARHQAAVAQLDLARAQFEQSKARLDELKINLANTVISSPVDGFVGKRFLDPGASVSPNVPVASVVDIHNVRMVANLVEKDLKRVTAGTRAAVEVDAFPGETFAGRVSRVAPVFDPATRTAEMEIEVPNPGYRLKPGMYARVQLTVSMRPDAVAVPNNAIVNLGGKPGVFVAVAGEGRSGGNAGGAGSNGGGQPEPRTQGTGGGAQGGGADRTQGGSPDRVMTAKFLPIEVGIHDGDNVEVVAGLKDGARVITTGAGALKDGDRIVAANADGGGRHRGGATGTQGAPGGSPRAGER